MIIRGEQKGPELTITVIFDEPAQVPVFEKFFLEALQKVAEAQGTDVVSMNAEKLSSIQDAVVNPDSKKAFNNKFIS